MNPSAERNATQSAKSGTTQENPGSRAVRIEGHISRPVVGEGRQTPDRQMFFVNSRPCNLPQVAKAFNEVYKSFNITQSPFVFADIKLDTNAYDVNVSPDKRTIMLHDQTTLLENLKNTLHELFEGQNQSVPQAQLVGKKLITSTLDPPTTQPRPDTQSTLDDNYGAGERTINEPELPIQRAGMVFPPNAHDETARLGFVKASRLERFAGRDTEDRVDISSVRRNRSTSQGSSRATNRRAVSDVSQKNILSAEGRELVELPHGSASSSPISEPDNPLPAVPMQLPQPCKAVQDFNARVASEKPSHVSSPMSPSSMLATDETDPGIPSVKQTMHVNTSQSSIQNAFDRMRPMRTPLQQATITIGDTTTINTVGTGSQTSTAKRARIQSRKEKTPSTSVFQKRLSGFTAPGTQIESSEDEADSEGYQTRGRPSLPILSPPPRKQLSLKISEEPCADDMMIPSSALSIHSPLGQDQSSPGTSSKSNEQLEGAVAGEDSDNEYIDETEKKSREEARVVQMIADAEKAASRPTEVNLQRASKLFKNTPKKYWTINIERVIETSVDAICQQLSNIQHATQNSEPGTDESNPEAPHGDLTQEDPEERLSLTVTKRDFSEMRIVGQFNLGFIIAVRPPTRTSPGSDVFIIDQHASDEKYNFERLSATTTLVSQRLVHPHPLELTAVEEELISANEHALKANGFTVEMNPSQHTEDDGPGHRASLTALPMSKEVTFTPTDLEELLALILDNPPSSSMSTSPHIPRPSKVRKLLASRACRSSVMIGKTLQPPRMREIVRHMGSMDKPWSCPHGRPTMRHLFGLAGWVSWNEGDGVMGVDVSGGETDWTGYLRASKR